MVGPETGTLSMIDLGLCQEPIVPPTRAALGITDERFDDLAAMAIQDPTAGSNPRQTPWTLPVSCSRTPGAG